MFVPPTDIYSFCVWGCFVKWEKEIRKSKTCTMI